MTEETVKKQKVVSFTYTILDENQAIQEQSDLPMSYLHGVRNIIPGLEKAMAGKAIGDEFEVTLAPEEAYGERKPNSIQRIPAKRFNNAKRLQPGQAVSIQTRQGQMQGVVVKVGRFNIDVDINHPLAGQTLTFEIEITDIRDASEEETAHGHVHGPGGVEH